MLNRARSIAAWVCTLSLVFALTPLGTVAFAQQTVGGDLTDVTVTTSADWSHSADASSASDRAESLVFESGSANYVVTTFAEGVGDIDYAMSLLAIDGDVQDVEVAATYALRTVSVNGAAYAVFSVVTGGNVHTVISPVSEFAQAVSATQSGVQVNGGPVFTGVDGAALQSIFESASGGEVDVSAAPALLSSDAAVPIEEETTEGEDDTPETGDADDADGATPDAADTDEVAPDDGAVGFLDDNTWVSPLFGTRITWDSTWEAQSFGGEKQFISYEDGEYSYEQLCLRPAGDRLGNQWCATVRYSGGYFTTPAYWEQTYGEGGSTPFSGVPYYGVVLTDDGYAAADTYLTGEYARLTQGHADADVFIEQSITATTAELPDSVDAVVAGVQIDEQSPFHLVDPATFRAESDAMAASLPELAAQRDADMEAMGLVDLNTYVSTATGCEVSWSDDLVLNGMDRMTPISIESSWNSVAGESIPAEVFSLWPVSVGTSFNISCFESLESMDGFYDWDSEDATRVETDSAEYLIRPWSENDFGVYIVLKPIGEPTVQVSFSVSRDQLTEMQANGEPGLLVIGGVDLIELIQEDDLVSELP